MKALIQILYTLSHAGTNSVPIVMYVEGFVERLIFCCFDYSLFFQTRNA